MKDSHVQYPCPISPASPQTTRLRHQPGANAPHPRGLGRLLARQLLRRLVPARVQLEVRDEGRHDSVLRLSEMGYADDVIEPHETRPRLVSALLAARNKREQRPARKHGNIPLLINHRRS